MAPYRRHSDPRTAKRSTKAPQKVSSDVYLPDPRATDIVVPVLGQTGAGKSTFINNLLGREDASVGAGVDPETRQVRSYTLPHPHHADRRLVILDSPGFNSTPDDETSIFARVSEWLAHSYRGMQKTFAGVIYLHEITQTRLQPKPLRLLKQRCDEWGSTNVVLATTKWNEIQKESEDHREQLLKEDWRYAMQEGQMCRLFDTSESAHEVWELVLERVTGLGGPLSNSKMNSERPRGVKESREGSVHVGSHLSERASDRRVKDENRDASAESFYSSTRYSPNTTLKASSQQVGTNGASSSGGSVLSSKQAGRQQKRKMNGSGPMSSPSIADSPRPSLLCCC